MERAIDLNTAISRRGHYKIGSKCNECFSSLGENKNQGCKTCKAA